MSVRYAVVKGNGGVPVVVVRAHELVRLLSRVALLLALATPVIAVGGGVDVGRRVAVVVGGGDNAQALDEEIAL